MSLKWSGLGINIGGYGTIDSTWPTTVTKYYNDLVRNKQVGYAKTRIGGTDPTFTNSYPLSKQIALYSVGLNLDTMWGLTTSSTLTAANYAAYEANVLLAAQWAQDNGITRIYIGNELEAINDNTTLTDSQLFDNLKVTAALVQAIYTNGPVCYCSTAGATIANLWISKGITPGTDFDNLYFQPYGGGQTDLTGFAADCQRIWDGLGSLAKISEFNLVTQGGSLTISPERQEIQMDRRIAIIRSIGFDEAYFFVDKKTSPSEVDAVALQDGSFKQYYWSFVGGRRWFYNT